MNELAQVKETDTDQGQNQTPLFVNDIEVTAVNEHTTLGKYPATTEIYPDENVDLGDKKIDQLTYPDPEYQRAIDRRNKEILEESKKETDVTISETIEPLDLTLDQKVNQILGHIQDVIPRSRAIFRKDKTEAAVINKNELTYQEYSLLVEKAQKANLKVAEDKNGDILIARRRFEKNIPRTFVRHGEKEEGPMTKEEYEAAQATAKLRETLGGKIWQGMRTLASQIPYVPGMIVRNIPITGAIHKQREFMEQFGEYDSEGWFAGVKDFLSLYWAGEFKWGKKVQYDEEQYRNSSNIKKIKLDGEINLADDENINKRKEILRSRGLGNGKVLDSLVSAFNNPGVALKTVYQGFEAGIFFGAMIGGGYELLRNFGKGIAEVSAYNSPAWIDFFRTINWGKYPLVESFQRVDRLVRQGEIKFKEFLTASALAIPSAFTMMFLSTYPSEMSASGLNRFLKLMGVRSDMIRNVSERTLAWSIKRTIIAFAPYMMFDLFGNNIRRLGFTEEELKNTRSEFLRAGSSLRSTILLGQAGLLDQGDFITGMVKGTFGERAGRFTDHFFRITSINYVRELFADTTQRAGGVRLNTDLDRSLDNTQRQLNTNAFDATTVTISDYNYDWLSSWQGKESIDPEELPVIKESIRATYEYISTHPNVIYSLSNEYRLGYGAFNEQELIKIALFHYAVNSGLDSGAEPISIATVIEGMIGDPTKRIAGNREYIYAANAINLNNYFDEFDREYLGNGQFSTDQVAMVEPTDQVVGLGETLETEVQTQIEGTTSTNTSENESRDNVEVVRELGATRELTGEDLRASIPETSPGLNQDQQGPHIFINVPAREEWISQAGINTSGYFERMNAVNTAAVILQDLDISGVDSEEDYKKWLEKYGIFLADNDPRIKNWRDIKVQSDVALYIASQVMQGPDTPENIQNGTGYNQRIWDINNNSTTKGISGYVQDYIEAVANDQEGVKNNYNNPYDGAVELLTRSSTALSGEWGQVIEITEEISEPEEVILPEETTETPEEVIPADEVTVPQPSVTVITTTAVTVGDETMEFSISHNLETDEYFATTPEGETVSLETTATGFVGDKVFNAPESEGTYELAVPGTSYFVIPIDIETVNNSVATNVIINEKGETVGYKFTDLAGESHLFWKIAHVETGNQYLVEAGNQNVLYDINAFEDNALIDRLREPAAVLNDEGWLLKDFAISEGTEARLFYNPQDFNGSFVAPYWIVQDFGNITNSLNRGFVLLNTPEGIAPFERTYDSFEYGIYEYQGKVWVVDNENDYISKGDKYIVSGSIPDLASQDEEIYLFHNESGEAIVLNTNTGSRVINDPNIQVDDTNKTISYTVDVVPSIQGQSFVSQGGLIQGEKFEANVGDLNRSIVIDSNGSIYEGDGNNSQKFTSIQIGDGEYIIAYALDPDTVEYYYLAPNNNGGYTFDVKESLAELQEQYPQILDENINNLQSLVVPFNTTIELKDETYDNLQITRRFDSSNIYTVNITTLDRHSLFITTAREIDGPPALNIGVDANGEPINVNIPDNINPLASGNYLLIEKEFETEGAKKVQIITGSDGVAGYRLVDSYGVSEYWYVEYEGNVYLVNPERPQTLLDPTSIDLNSNVGPIESASILFHTVNEQEPPTIEVLNEYITVQNGILASRVFIPSDEKDDRIINGFIAWDNPTVPVIKDETTNEYIALTPVQNLIFSDPNIRFLEVNINGNSFEFLEPTQMDSSNPQYYFINSEIDQYYKATRFNITDEMVTNGINPVSDSMNIFLVGYQDSDNIWHVFDQSGNEVDLTAAGLEIQGDTLVALSTETPVAPSVTPTATDMAPATEAIIPTETPDELATQQSAQQTATQIIENATAIAQQTQDAITPTETLEPTGTPTETLTNTPTLTETTSPTASVTSSLTPSSTSSSTPTETLTPIPTDTLQPTEVASVPEPIVENITTINTPVNLEDNVISEINITRPDPNILQYNVTLTDIDNNTTNSAGFPFIYSGIPVPGQFDSNGDRLLLETTSPIEGVTGGYIIVDRNLSSDPLVQVSPILGQEGIAGYRVVHMDDNGSTESAATYWIVNYNGRDYLVSDDNPYDESTSTPLPDSVINPINITLYETNAINPNTGDFKLDPVNESRTIILDENGQSVIYNSIQDKEVEGFENVNVLIPYEDYEGTGALYPVIRDAKYIDAEGNINNIDAIITDSVGLHPLNQSSGTTFNLSEEGWNLYLTPDSSEAYLLPVGSDNMEIREVELYEISLLLRSKLHTLGDEDLRTFVYNDSRGVWHVFNKDGEEIDFSELPGGSFVNVDGRRLALFANVNEYTFEDGSTGTRYSAGGRSFVIDENGGIFNGDGRENGIKDDIKFNNGSLLLSYAPFSSNRNTRDFYYVYPMGEKFVFEYYRSFEELIEDYPNLNGLRYDDGSDEFIVPDNFNEISQVNTPTVTPAPSQTVIPTIDVQGTSVAGTLESAQSTVTVLNENATEIAASPTASVTPSPTDTIEPTVTNTDVPTETLVPPTVTPTPTATPTLTPTNTSTSPVEVAAIPNEMYTNLDVNSPEYVENTTFYTTILSGTETYESTDREREFEGSALQIAMIYLDPNNDNLSNEGLESLDKATFVEPGTLGYQFINQRPGSTASSVFKIEFNGEGGWVIQSSDIVYSATLRESLFNEEQIQSLVTNQLNFNNEIAQYLGYGDSSALLAWDMREGPIGAMLEFDQHWLMSQAEIAHNPSYIFEFNGVNYGGNPDTALPEFIELVNQVTNSNYDTTNPQQFLQDMHNGSFWEWDRKFNEQTGNHLMELFKISRDNGWESAGYIHSDEVVALETVVPTVTDIPNNTATPSPTPSNIPTNTIEPTEVSLLPTESPTPTPINESLEVANADNLENNVNEVIDMQRDEDNLFIRSNGTVLNEIFERNNYLTANYEDRDLPTPYIAEASYTVYGPSSNAIGNLKINAEDMYHQIELGILDKSELTQEQIRILEVYDRYKEINIDADFPEGTPYTDPEYAQAFYEEVLKPLGYDGLVATKVGEDLGRVGLVQLWNPITERWEGSYKLLILDASSGVDWYNTNKEDRKFEFTNTGVDMRWMFEIPREIIRSAGIPSDNNNVGYVRWVEEDIAEQYQINFPVYEERNLPLTTPSSIQFAHSINESMHNSVLDLDNIPVDFEYSANNTTHRSEINQDTFLTYVFELAGIDVHQSRIPITVALEDANSEFGFPKGLLEQWNLFNRLDSANQTTRTVYIPGETNIDSVLNDNQWGVFFVERVTNNKGDAQPLEVGIIKEDADGNLEFIIFENGVISRLTESEVQNLIKENDQRIVLFTSTTTAEGIQ